jgi:hypothetical protein
MSGLRGHFVALERSKCTLVEDPKYEREIINGLAPFFNEKAPDDMLHFYTKDELAELMQLKGTERDVEPRMPVKITRHYYDLAVKSDAISAIVKASPDETETSRAPRTRATRWTTARSRACCTSTRWG